LGNTKKRSRQGKVRKTSSTLSRLSSCDAAARSNLLVLLHRGAVGSPTHALDSVLLHAAPPDAGESKSPRRDDDVVFRTMGRSGACAGRLGYAALPQQQLADGAEAAAAAVPGRPWAKARPDARDAVNGHRPTLLDGTGVLTAAKREPPRGREARQDPPRPASLGRWRETWSQMAAIPETVGDVASLALRGAAGCLDRLPVLYCTMMADWRWISRSVVGSSGCGWDGTAGKSRFRQPARHLPACAVPSLPIPGRLDSVPSLRARRRLEGALGPQASSLAVTLAGRGGGTAQ